jgi:hypothetical protein
LTVKFVDQLLQYGQAAYASDVALQAGASTEQRVLMIKMLHSAL